LKGVGGKAYVLGRALGASELVYDVARSTGVVIKDGIGAVSGMTVEGSGRGVDVASFTTGFLAREGTFLLTGSVVGVVGSGFYNEVADVGGLLKVTLGGRGSDHEWFLHRQECCNHYGGCRSTCEGRGSRLW
jgi:hypothetical protein